MSNSNVWEAVGFVQPGEAQELCSTAEWKLVESSFPPFVAGLTAADLKSKIERARKLHQRCADLIPLQHAESRKQTTHRKEALFAETAQRFEAAMGHIEPAMSVDSSAEAADVKPLEESGSGRVAGVPERAEPETRGRKHAAPPGLAGQGEPQRQKPGPRPIPGRGGSAIRRPQGRRASKSR